MDSSASTTHINGLTTLVAGLAGEPRGGLDVERETHQGRIAVRCIQQMPPEQVIAWKSAPLPGGSTTKQITFAWSGALGGGVCAAGNFAVSVNGRKAAVFDVAIGPTRFLACAEGCELLYAVALTHHDQREYTRDSSGYFYLTVPAEWVQPSEPAMIEVRAADAGSDRWFGLIVGDDAALAIPDRVWEPFTQGGAPKPDSIPKPPPLGEEAGYEWYKAQFDDIGMWTTIGPPSDPSQTAVSTMGQLFCASDVWRHHRGGEYRIRGTWPPYIIRAFALALYENGKVVPFGDGERPYQALAGGDMPIVTSWWWWRRGDLELSQIAFAEPLGGVAPHSGLERTLAWVKLDVTNVGKSARDVVLLGFYTGTEEEPDPPLTFRDGAVLWDGSAFMSAQAPKGFSVEFNTVFPTGRRPQTLGERLELLRSRNGVFNALVICCRLAPGQTAPLVFRRVMESPGTLHRKPEALPPVKPKELAAGSFEASLAAAKATWRGLAERVARFSTPDGVLDRIVRKGMLDGYSLTKRWDGRAVVFDSTPAGYLCQWDDASCKWFYVLDLMGDHETSRRLLDTVFERQGCRNPNGTRTHEGCFSDVTNTRQDGSDASWASCNGWALWAMAQHARLTNDRRWVAEHKAEIVAGCDWIIRERAFSKEIPNNPCAGLLYGHFTCDCGDISGYLVYTDAISHLGLQSIARVLSECGHAEGARLLDEAEAYRRDILAAVDRVTDKSTDPWFIPRVLGDPSYWNYYSYGNTGPINLVFGGVLELDDERTDHLVRWLIDTMRGGSLEAAATGNMFYAQDLAVVLLELGRVEEFLRMFYTLLAANVSQETLTTGEWRGNAMPHVHSVSAIVRMFRTMLIEERDESLYLLQGVPRRWLEDGKEIRIDEAPTWYGPISLRCVSAINEGVVSVELSVPERIGNTPMRLNVRLPAGLKLAKATARGARSLTTDGDWIELTGSQGQIKITATVVRK